MDKPTLEKIYGFDKNGSRFYETIVRDGQGNLFFADRSDSEATVVLQNQSSCFVPKEKAFALLGNAFSEPGIPRMAFEWLFTNWDIVEPINLPPHGIPKLCALPDAKPSAGRH